MMKNNPTPKSTLFLAASFYPHISHVRRLQFLFLLALTIASAFAEVLSLSAVVPFIGILTDPAKVFYYPLMAPVISILELEKPTDLVLPLAIFFIFSAIFAGFLRLALLRFSIRFSNAIGADFGINAYSRTLHQPYSVHVSRSSSEIISGITLKVGVATGTFTSLVSILTSSVLFLAIFGTLIAIDPFVASIAMASFGTIYVIIAWMTQYRLLNNSACIAKEQTEVVKSLQEGLGAIRDILLDGTQTIYSNTYGKALWRLQIANGDNVFINIAPRYAMEATGMVLIAMLAYYLSFQSGGIGAAFPVLGALALGAQRLLPVLQQIYGNLVVVRGSHAALADVLALLEQPLPRLLNQSNIQPFKFSDDIVLKNLSFQYNSIEKNILLNTNLTIKKGMRVGIIGTTGSGKSTLIDLIMGLLDPTGGSVLVDGGTIHGELRKSWQRNIAHVPQSIFLTDATIAENIAFGIPLDQIDMIEVKLAAQKAQLSGFIETHESGFAAIVGERGVRISGGQRQRIGIARALYKKSEILIFDEATSALDTMTENSVMDAIDKLGSDLTVLIIAHRITTLKNCDLVVKLENGGIVDKGSYETVMRNNINLDSKIV